MTVGTRQTTSNTITRCAVCKVDLKGRFVFIDDRAEHLFGCGPEDLFGKNIMDFLDTPSRAVVTEILSRRNHYEICYDSIVLNITDHNKSLKRTQTVVSLNFNAGNPVNFQFIFHPEQTVEVSPVAAGGEGDDYGPFVNSLIGTDITADWRGFLRSLRDFVGASQTCTYIVSEGGLELRACAAGDGDEFSYATIADPGPIHTTVARDGGVYDFTDEDSVRRAVELNTEAPAEIVSRLICDDAVYLVRLVFDADLDDVSAQNCTARAHFALRLMDRLVASNAMATARDDAGIQFAVGLLDGMGIGAFVTNSDGRVALYNPRGIELLQWDGADCAIDDLAAALADGNNDDSLLTVLHPSDIDDDKPPVPARVHLPDGRSGMLMSLPLGDGGDDQSAFVMLVPGAPGISAEDLCHYCRPLVSRLLDNNSKAGEQIAKLTQEPPKTADAAESALQPAVDSIEENEYLVSSLRTVLDLQAVPAENKTTDLNTIVHRAVNNIIGRRPEHPLKYKTPSMPKVMAAADRINLAVGSLLDDVARFTSPSAKPLTVEAECSDGTCCLRFCVPDYTGPRLHDCTGGDSTTGGDDTTDHAPGMALARLLMKSLGGTFSCSDEQDHTVFELVFPATAAN